MEENVHADVAAKQVVTQKIFDAGGDLTHIPNEDLATAGIDSTCNLSNNAHEHHEWPLYPIPEHEGMDTAFSESTLYKRDIAPRRDMARWLQPKGA